MDFWDNIAAVYDIAEAVNGKVYREMTEFVARLVPKGAKVLDCAAGTGALSLAAARKAESVLCTDLSENMLFRARKKAKRARVDNIRFEKRNILDLCDADDTYDAVIAGNVLHLLDDPGAAVRELCRVVKSGGRLILPTFIVDNDNAIIKLYRVMGFSPKMEFTPESYFETLKKFGCGKVRMKVINGMIPCCLAVIDTEKQRDTPDKITRKENIS